MQIFRENNPVQWQLVELNHNLFLCQLAFKGKATAIDHRSRKSPEQLSFRDENGASPLHFASAGGNVDIIRLIVSVVGPEGKS